MYNRNVLGKRNIEKQIDVLGKMMLKETIVWLAKANGVKTV